jgi:transcription-repair coupling factor (superfamily II helicase)
MTAGWLAPLREGGAFARAREGLARDGRLDLSGLEGSAGLLAALLVAEGPMLVVVPREREVEAAAADLRMLSGELGSAAAVLPLPAPGPPPFRGLPRHPDASLKRAAVLCAARRGTLRALVASPAGLLRPALTASRLESRVVLLRAGDELTPEILLEALDENGYVREDPVVAPGHAAGRGGIVDVFPPDAVGPVRIEFFGDTLESLRRFDPETQRTSAALDAFELLPLSDVFATRQLQAQLTVRLRERFAGHRDLPGLLERLAHGLAGEEVPELLPLVTGATVAPWEHLAGATLAAWEPEDVLAEAEAFSARARDDRAARGDALVPGADEALVPVEALRARLEAAPALHLRRIDAEGRGVHVASRPTRRYSGDLRALAAELKQDSGRHVIFLGNAGRADRLRDVLHQDDLVTGEQQRIEVRVGALSRGFELPDAALRVLADGDVFPEEVHLHPRGPRRGARSFLSDFRDLRIGDLVVHQDHGIGRFEGLETLEVVGARREFMVIGYQGGDRLKVPVEAFDRVQKYAGGENARPPLDRLGSGRWDKVKKRVKKAMRDMAAELLKLYAERKARPGHAFAGESPWQREFEEAFEYEETPDQAAAIEQVAADMASDAPMDRLICGDVGYGKTEVAMRAAMRAVLDGKQVALLAPTTVLALQHWQTFRKRFAPFPVRVEMVSRFRSPREVAQVLRELAAGKVDLLIGTHRLLSKDVAFRDLGLLVVDEEQRFGVAAKERLKKLRVNVDCLTLSATPIPRTLQMGLAGIRDMSVIETPPRDRLAIQTSIVKFSTDVIAAAVRQELARDGQVYVVHHRVDSIYSLAAMIQRLVPEARVGVAHGQLPEAELEKAMVGFVEGRADVLVATTLIENGLDIPRANTLIVNRADRYGLAQLYQLRGRVGRSDRRAYAYLLVPPDTVLSEIARRRLAAIREFSELGAGFRIAALDLELRGAGNLLGGEQSGHVEAVGLDLYVKLLQQTILELKGEPSGDGPRVTLNLKLDLRIPEAYVPDVHQRMSLYKRVSQAQGDAELTALQDETRDRYGPLAREVQVLFDYGRRRLAAEALGIRQVDLGAGALLLSFLPDTPLPPAVIVDLVHGLPGTRLDPRGVLRVPLAEETPPLEALGELLAALSARLPSGATGVDAPRRPESGVEPGVKPAGL